MLSAKRKAQILAFIRQHQQSSVVELSSRFGASIPTIRRDLTNLQKEGYIRRIHGGAVLEKRSLIDLSYQQREQKFIQQKRYIAEKALELIHAGDRIFFNDGTTIMQIAKLLVKKKIPLEVMTNSIKVADILLFNNEIDVMLIGGSIREHSYACSGPFAELVIESLNANKAIISADAFHPEWGISIHSIAMGSLTRKMIAKSEQVIVVGDSSKMRTPAAMTVCTWKEVDVFISDSVSAEALDMIGKNSVEIIS
jgi:DeoR/GlpR family transcriptional regulator of sugar metabolism